MSSPLKITILGRSTASPQAAVWRGLLWELGALGHDVLFLDRAASLTSAAEASDMSPSALRTYDSLDELQDRYAAEVRSSDLVIVTSRVPEGSAAGRWVISQTRGAAAFYDLEPPVTLARMDAGVCEWLSPDLVGDYDGYLSASGGPMLAHLAHGRGARNVAALFASGDPGLYQASRPPLRWDLGHWAWRVPGCRRALDCLLLKVAGQWPTGRFVLAGQGTSRLQGDLPNIQRLEESWASGRGEFFASQRFTLIVTRHEMVRSGWTPPQSLFEAAACGATIITDYWRGLEEFFEIGSEVLVAHRSGHVLKYLQEMDESRRAEIGRRARSRVLTSHSPAHRAGQLDNWARHVLDSMALARA